MANETPSSEARLTRIESDVAHMRSEVATFMEATSKAIASLTVQVGAIGKPNWSLLISAFSVLIPVLVCGFWIIQQSFANSIGPLQTKAERSEMDRAHLNMQINRLDDQVDELREEMRANTARYTAIFTEIETQFSAQAQLANMRAAARNQISALLWKKVYGDDLPSGEYFYNMSQNRSQTQ